MNMDIWAKWLLERRCAGDEAFRASVQQGMERVRDRVLKGARVRQGMTLVDVGAGEGLIGFGAIEKIGPSLKVIFTDLSHSMLEHVEALAKEKGVESQCRFVPGTAERLVGLPDTSVDVVATRASLAYVGNKPAAFAEIYRVLKPGGRLSIAEPVAQDASLELLAMARLIDSRPNHPDNAYLKLLHRFRAAQFPSSEIEIAQNPITNYSERDLLGMVRASQFEEAHLELHVDVRKATDMNWDNYLDISPHPWAPTLREIFHRSFSAAEKAVLEGVLKPLLQSGRAVTQETVAYITATKPLETHVPMSNPSEIPYAL